MRIGYVRVLVFWSGLVTLGAELSASRLVAPYFGSSLLVWSSLIGLILVGLALGYWVGGRWADRAPRDETLLTAALAAGAAVALVPLVSRPVLSIAFGAFGDLEWGILLGSFAGVLCLLGIPMVLLGCITPVAVRLATRSANEAGRVAGSLFALSTAGSFLGAFLPVMFLIPAWGTRNTFLFLGLSLLVLSVPGWLLRARRAAGIAALLFALFLPPLAHAMDRGPLKPAEGLLFEGESAYHYLRVLRDRMGWVNLEVNEGVVSHSRYHPGAYFTGGEWDYFAIAPCFNAAPYHPLEAARSWALIGMGAGTTARLVTETYGPVDIHGVEIDPLIVTLGRTHFGMTYPNLRVDVADGRTWLMSNTNRYDVIGIDAYRQPYIPFELSTVEFFRLVNERLTGNGVAAINVGRTPNDLRLVDALAATLRQVFPSVFLVDVHHRRNTIIVGTKAPSRVDHFRTNVEALPHPVLRLVGRRALESAREATPGGLVLTDDCAPVERLMDLLLVREVLRQGEGHFLNAER